jgi:iron-sulfur cluster repair protein YtfE (RIC family)
MNENEDPNWLNHDHLEYEELLLDCRAAAEAEEWRSAKELFEKLVAHVKVHMLIEEEILYPAYEKAVNVPHGPTKALREEHDEIYRLMRDLSHVLKTNDSDLFLESLLPLEKVMIKHHEKEEEIFLPMAGHVLLAQREEIMRRLKEFNKEKGGRNWDF